jgi:hypothetical protein
VGEPHLSWARCTVGVRSDAQPKSSIPIGAKVEMGLKGFTLGGVKAEIQKNVFNLPQVTNTCYIPSYKMGMGKLP